MNPTLKVVPYAWEILETLKSELKYCHEDGLVCYLQFFDKDNWKIISQHPKVYHPSVPVGWTQIEIELEKNLTEEQMEELAIEVQAKLDQWLQNK